VELTAETVELCTYQMFAHGYQALTDGAEVLYQVSEFTPGYERGLRYNDPFFNIEWPLPVSVIAERCGLAFV